MQHKFLHTHKVNEKGKTKLRQSRLSESRWRRKANAGDLCGMFNVLVFTASIKAFLEFNIRVC
jgi:hypothetical protein